MAKKTFRYYVETTTSIAPELSQHQLNQICKVHAQGITKEGHSWAEIETPLQAHEWMNRYFMVLQGVLFTIRLIQPNEGDAQSKQLSLIP